MKKRHKMAVSLSIAVLLVALGVAALFWSFNQTEDAAAIRKHTYGILNRADDLLSALKDAETGQRGYLLTGDEAFLEPYLAVRDGINGHMKELRQLTLISSAQRRLDILTPMIDTTAASV